VNSKPFALTLSNDQSVVKRSIFAIQQLSMNGGFPVPAESSLTCLYSPPKMNAEWRIPSHSRSG
jgi:hypothetical protein